MFKRKTKQLEMEEIFYRTFYGSKTVVISVAKMEDESFSFAIAKYLTKSKSHLESHQQFSLRKEQFEEFLSELTKNKMELDNERA